MNSTCLLFAFRLKSSAESVPLNVSNASSPAQIDLNKLSGIEKRFIRQIEEMNKQRVEKLRKTRLRNRITGLALVGLICSIYFYSINAVKQEDELDNLDDPNSSKP